MQRTLWPTFKPKSLILKSIDWVCVCRFMSSSPCWDSARPLDSNKVLEFMLGFQSHNTFATATPWEVFQLNFFHVKHVLVACRLLSLEVRGAVFVIWGRITKCNRCRSFTSVTVIARSAGRVHFFCCSRSNYEVIYSLYVFVCIREHICPPVKSTTL
jgi:hypothetical protein